MRIGAMTLIEPRRVALASQFIRHYRRWCEAPDIHVVVIGCDDSTAMENLVILSGCTLHRDPMPFETIPTHNRIKALTRQVFDWDGWHFNVDSDEFFDPSINVKSLCASCDGEGLVTVKAEMIDMLSPDGDLRVIPDPDTLSIYDTFPVEARFTKAVSRGGIFKFCLNRNPYYGQHTPHGASSGITADTYCDYPPVPVDQRCSTVFKLHHFKWDSTARERMQLRIDHPERFPYWPEFQRFVDYFEEHGKVDVDAFRL